jgi:hypothetical protein
MQQELEPLTDTLKPIYANFIFREERQALAFAGLIVERDWSVSVAYFRPGHQSLPKALAVHTELGNIWRRRR